MSNYYPEYSVAIRTLGKAGDAYQQLLDSLSMQSAKPKSIFVFLAEGYPIPKETIGCEKIVYVKKGMVAQRALDYSEIDTEWILMLDDDVALGSDCVEKMFQYIESENIDVLAFDGFPKNELRLLAKIKMCISLSSIPRLFKRNKGYLINSCGGYSYNPKPSKSVLQSTTNSGNGFMVRKTDFLNLHFEEEIWLDKMGYAFPDDAVMFYKMHLKGFRVFTWFNAPFVHLDAHSALKDNRNNTEESSKALENMYISIHNCYIFYYRYIYPNLNVGKQFIGLSLRFLANIVKYLSFFFINGNPIERIRLSRKAVSDAKILLNELNRTPLSLNNGKIRL